MAKKITAALITLLALSTFFKSISLAADDPSRREIRGQEMDRDVRLAGAVGERVLRIGLVDCIAYALKNNSEIKIKRIDPKLKNDDIKIARAAFEPDFSAEFSWHDNTVASANVLEGADTFNSKDVNLNAGVSGKLPTGTRYAVDFYNQKYQSDSVFQEINPYYAVEPKITITQPLFKNFGVVINRADIVLAKNYSLESEESFKDKVMDIISRAKSAYYDYVFSLQAQAIARAALSRAQELLVINKARYAKGLVSSVELLETEAAASDKEKSVIFAEYEVAKTQDNLKLVTNLIDDPDVWNARIELVDKPDFSVEKVDLVECLKNAFIYRPDYSIAKIGLVNRDIKIMQAKNAIFPELDLIGSFGLNGLGEDYVAAIGKMNTNYEDWSAGLKFSIPWGGAERAKLDQKKLEKAQALLAYKKLQDDIILEVRDKVRRMDTGYRQVLTSRISRQKEAENYAAQKERYAVGQVSTHDLLDYQNNLSSAELDYVKSVIAYKISLINLEKSEGMTLVKNDIKLE